MAIKWNIVFLIYAELLDGATPPTSTVELPNDSPEVLTSKHLKEFTDEILSISPGDNFNLFVIENQVSLKNGVVVSDTTTLNLLEKDPLAHTKGILSKKREYNFENFLKKQEMVSAAFKEIDTNVNWKADKIMLFTWDHGSAFGIFKSIIPDVKINTQYENIFKDRYSSFNKSSIKLKLFNKDKDLTFCIIKNKPYRREKRTQNGISNSSNEISTHVEILTNHELGQAIIDGFGGKSVDMLCMFNCCMQNVHTAFALNSCVKMLVAPEGIISMPGYDYVSIVNIVNTMPEINNDDLAKFVLSSMERKFSDAMLEYKFEQHAMFAIRLENYEKIVINPLASLAEDLTRYIRQGSLPKELVKYSRKNCYELTYPLKYYVIDLINWLCRLKEDTHDAYAVAFKHDNFVSDCNNLICDSRIGSQVYTVRGFDNRKAPTGFAIYLPPDSLAYSTQDTTRIDFINLNSLNRDYLISRIKWQDMLAELFN